MSPNRVRASHSEIPAETQLLESAATFAKALARLLQSMFGKELNPAETGLDELGKYSRHDLMVSLMFTGSFYGEFILSANLQQVQNILGLSGSTEIETKEQAADILSELLNIVAGECFSDLINEKTKLTLTAPKVFFGVVKFPKIKAAKTTLNFEGTAAIDCVLYLDRMKLDIDTSYRSALGELGVVNSDLMDALDKLQSQQHHLIQAEKMVALGTMAAGVAHEINTPLSTIIMAEQQMKEALATGQTDASGLFKMLSVIETTAHKISKITKSLRFYASDTRGEAFEIKNLEFVVQEALHPWKEALLKKNIRVILDASLSAIEMECRPIQLAQVFYDLINNSIYAVSECENKWIRIKSTDLGNEVAVSVADSGEGIPLNVQSKVFDPFFTTKKFGEGIGLGLSHARGILSGHGGTIELMGYSKNTEFVLILPKKQKQNKAA